MSNHTPISGIYVILNTKNGKVYIGQAANFRQRWNAHKSRLNKGHHQNHHLQAAWNKYGAKAFKFQKLEYCPIEKLDEREQHYLDVYMAKGICYNIAKNAQSAGRGLKLSEETKRKISVANKGKPRSLETRQRMSEANRRRIFSPETRLKMSKSAKSRPPISEETRQRLHDNSAGENNPRFGKPMSEETKKKISEAQKARLAAKRQNK
jgi:group I intron endonuclease